MMTAAERTFVGFFFLAVIVAILAVPFLGIWPIASVILALVFFGCMAAFFNRQRDAARNRMEADRRPRYNGNK